MRLLAIASRGLAVASILLAGLVSCPQAYADVVGTIPGQFSVDPVGTANYKISIQVPPGVHGMQPDLALLYNSHAGNGDLGVGWSLSGLSVVTRCGQNLEDDGQWSPPSLTLNVFCLDGQRLMPTPGTSGEYRTKIATFQRVLTQSTPSHGPASFTVYDKTAMTRYYGTATVEMGSDGQTRLLWPLNKIVDPFGNYISYVYASAGGASINEYVLTEVDYGSNSGQVGRVVFNYNSGTRTDDEYLVTSNTGVSITKLLQSVQVYGPGALPVRTYKLTYGASQRTGRELLRSVQECDPGNNCLATTNVGWMADSWYGLGNGSDAPSVYTAAPGSWKALDLDGDGLLDYVFIGADDTVHVILGKALSTDIATGIPGDGNALRPNWSTVADFYGDGHQELLTPHVTGTGGCGATPSYYEMLKWQNGRLVVDSNYLLMGPAPNYVPPNEYQANVPVAIDVDGKGLPSLFTKWGQCGDSSTSEYLWFWHNNGHGWDAPVQTSIQMGDSDNAIVPINFTGKGYDEFYIGHCTASVCTLHGVYTWNTSTNAPQSIGSDFWGNSQAGPTFLDFNGDGLTDAAVPTQTQGQNQWCFFMNVGGNWSPPPLLQAGEPPAANCVTFDASLAPSAVAVDYYGNGHQDLMVPSTDSSGIIWWWVITVDPLTGHPGAPVDTGIRFYPSEFPIFADAKGHGQPDYLYQSGSYLSIQYNTNDTPELVSQIQITNSAGQSLGSTTNVTYLPLPLASLMGYTIDNAPNNVTLPAGVSAPAFGQGQIRLFSQPLPVVVEFQVDSGVNNNGLAAWIDTYYLYGGAQQDTWGRGFLGFSDVIAANSNTGLFTENTYSQGLLTVGTVLTTRQVKVQAGNNWVTAPVTQQTCVDLKGDTVNGHRDCSSNVVNYGGFDTTVLNGGQILSSTSACPSNPGSGTSCATNPVTTIALPTGGYFSYIKNAFVASYELGSTSGSPYKTVTTTPTYIVDPSGNNAETSRVVVETTTANGDDYKVDTNNVQYQDSVSPWCLGRVTATTVTDTWKNAGSSSIQTLSSSPAHTATFSYSGNCMLTEEDSNVLDPTGNVLSTLKKQYTPDQYGNIASTQITGTNISPRTNSVQYDQYGLYPVYVQNALGQVSTSNWDYRFGLATSATDPNDLTTSTTYDSFGRKAAGQGVMPAQKTAWTYNWCGSGVSCSSTNSVYAYTQLVNSETTPGTMITSAVTEYDRLGRAVLTTTYGLYGKPGYQATYYDVLGRAYLASKRYQSGDPVCWEYKIYDDLSRVTGDYQPASTADCQNQRGGVIQPGSAGPSAYHRVSTYKYAGLTSTATLNQEASSTTLNALGKAAVFTDPNGKSTSYAYDAWGNTSEVEDATGKNLTTVSSDSAGDKLSMTDPDMGTWPSYIYDALGELLSQTDARGNTVTMQYDLLGRATQRTELEGVSTWKYDIAYGAGVGRLAYKTGPNGYWEGYAYDGYGNPTDKITVASGQEYWVSTTYDSFGQVAQLVYPNLSGIDVSGTPAASSGLTVAQVLNPDNSTSFNLGWQLNSASQNGQIYHLYRTPSNITSTITTTVPAQYEIYSGPVPNWQDNTVTVDDTYTWWLQACNGTAPLCSAYITQSLVVVLPPTVPAFNLPAAVEPGMSWSVTWSTASLGQTGNPGPISYLAQVSYKGGAWTQLYSGAGTSITETSSGDGSYSYRVQACANGACSNFSAPSTETIAVQPSVPQSVTVPATVTPQTSPASIAVSWGAPAVNGGTANLSYTVAVYRNSALQRTSTAQSGTGFTDSETLDGTYSYTITVCDIVNTSLCKNASSSNAAVTLPPVNPGVPTYYGDANAPTWSISWIQSSTPGNPSGTASYTLQQSWNGGAFSNVTGTVTPGSTYWQITYAALQGGYYQNGTYTYQLRACTTDSAVSNTAACTAWIPSSGSGYATTIAPGVPTAIHVPAQSNWDGSFTVTYSPPAAGTGGVVTGYKGMVYDLACTEPPNANCITVPEATCTSTTTSCAFPANKLPAGNGYSLQIEALDSGVPSPWVQENEPNIVYTSPPPAPTLNETDASDGSHYTITYSASTATTYQLYFSSSTKTGSWSAWTQVYSGSATSYYTGSPIGQYYLRYYAVACNQHAQCSPNSSAYAFTNPKEVTGCMTCSQTNPPTPTPPPSSGTTASAVSVVPVRVALAAQATPAVAVPVTRVSAPEPEPPMLRALAMSTTARPGSNGLKRLRLPHPSTTVAGRVRSLAATHGRAYASRLLVAATLSPRQAYFLAHAARTTAPKPGHLRRVRNADPIVATARYAPPVDPILSLYPPLRLDPRVMAHFEARGGSVPGRVRNVDAGTDCRDTDNDVECTTPDSPNALMVGYSYDNYGHVVTVTRLDGNGNPQYNYWLAQAANANGEITQEALQLPTSNSSAGIGITRQYDIATGAVTCINTVTGGGQSGCTTGLTGTNVIQSDSYSWDSYGNLQNRTNAITGLNETSGYDLDNRLTSITTQYNGNIVASDAPAYSDQTGGTPGNIASRNGATYNYPLPGAVEPHAVSSISLPGATRSFSYDADGNLKSQTGDVTRTLTWYSYNKPDTITSGTTSESFLYGPDHDRYERVDQSPTDTVTTVYIGGLFEAQTDSASGVTTYRNYIVAGSELVATDSFQGTPGTTATETVTYYFHDHLGEVEATSDGSGQNVTQYSYDAWGKARPTSGATAFVTAAWGSCMPTLPGQHTGYGGHENLDDECLVHMEGRVYDPEMGRFLSADPTMQDPISTQGYDRYGYIQNNPLSGTDPTGYHFHDIAGPAEVVLLAASKSPCSYWCAAGAYALMAVDGYQQTGTYWGAAQTTLLNAGEIYAFSYIGDKFPGTYSISDPMFYAKIALEATTGGAFSAAGGGRFGDGFLSGAFGSFAGNYIPHGDGGFLDTAMAASAAYIVGGTASVIGGGSFSNGGSTAAFIELFNDLSHSYHYRRQVCSYSDEACTKLNAWAATKHVDFPGQDAGTAVENGHKYAVYGATKLGAITVYVNDDTMTVTNVTDDSHEFCCGSVTQQIVTGDDGVYLDITGSGTNRSWVSWGLNYAASLLFPTVDADYINYQIDVQFQQQMGRWPIGADPPITQRNAP